VNVFTYYADEVPGLYDSQPTSLGTAESQRELLKLWERNWKSRHWDPVVLTEADVRKHPRFDFFHEHFRYKPTEYGERYTVACWLRWLAMAQVGGGMLVDYDVFSYEFKPSDAAGYDPHDMMIFANNPPERLFMGAVLGSAQHYLDMCELFIAAVPCEHDWNKKAGLFHQDDLSLLLRMFEGTLYKPEWLHRLPGCALFPQGDWLTAPMTHYAYAMKLSGYWPKYKFVEGLRPF
jgi:hypothetical protein